MATDWTYVFTDARTDAELATLPMVGVSFEKVLNGTGKLTGTIPTADPRVRALNPWAATTPRRTCVYVYYGDTLVWGGMVWQQEKASDTPGLKIMAATFESWLTTQFLTVDMPFTGKTAVGMFTGVLAQVQSMAGADLNFTVVDGSPSVAAEIVRPDTTWKRIDLKDPLTLLGTFLNTQVPLEWRIDCVPQPGGRILKQLVIGEPRIGRTSDLSGLHVWHSVTDPYSTLLTFDDLDDGTVQANAATGSIPDPNGTNQLTQRLFAYHSAAEIGVDEVAAGYPLMIRGVSTMDRGVITQNDLDDAVLGAVADGMSQGKSMKNFTVGVDALPLASYDVGDDLDCEITHPAYQEWPGPSTSSLRILGRTITPRSGSTPDKVALTVWDADSPRLPRSTTLVAHIRDLIRRVKSLEIA